MRRLYLIIIYMCLTLVVGRVHAQYYSVNYDKQIVAAMAAAFGAGAMAESYYNEQVGEILKHYNAAEVATAEASSLPSSWSARHSPTSAFGAVARRTTITAASTIWWRTRLCPRYGRWQE